MGLQNNPTVRISNIPHTAVAKELVEFLESKTGPGSVYALEIFTERQNWKSRGFGRVQFATLDAKANAQSLSLQDRLVFKTHYLKISESSDDIIFRPANPRNRVDNGALYAGFMVEENCMSVLESWNGVRGWIMPERERFELWVWQEKECYKLEIMFQDILETYGYSLGKGKLNALLLKLKYGPKIYQKKAGPNIASKFKADRYHFCQEDFEFVWVRTTDFSPIKSVGHSTSFCWVIEEEPLAADIFQSFPLYRENLNELILEEGEEFCSSSEIVPLVKCGSDSKLPYEIIFQLNSLVHTQKISYASVDDDLVDLFGTLNEETSAVILQKLHNLKSTCYEPLKYVKSQLHVLRALITPSKIYCLGPELETSNYVVKHFASYASDFIRVTFVEEDWSKLPTIAVSTRIQKGIFSKSSETQIYKRILTILQDGIVIGDKRFEFLAYSASQLRSSSVWMFASNDSVTADYIREWMGMFKVIPSVSKCAARMGQLFSSSMQTLEVPTWDVELIPEIEITADDGTNYCFSDGIGKISRSFAKQVAEKCKLDHVPSAFQIRYGGYKGVIAVDQYSFRKLSLRKNMLKFASNSTMLNVAKWSESMPCFLNREIITLLSTLGVEDEVFEALQQDQLSVLAKMLNDRVAALNVLESLSGGDSKNILVKMLRQGYEPNIEPYLSMMIRAYYEHQLSDLKSRCRIFVPKGRILIGCLDETGLLNYGQVYVRMTMTKSELECGDENLRKVDESTCVIVGKVVVTKNPCLHPGDIRVLDAIYDEQLEDNGLRDCLVFPQNGPRPHPNECSGGDLDGDQYFISWDKGLIPCKTVAPMDCSRRPRVMDHEVTLKEIQQFFVDYMINDTLGAISTAHLVHADRDPEKAMSRKCLALAELHSMAVDFAKTGNPAEMPRALKPREFPDFMERVGKPMYMSKGVLGILYRTIIELILQQRSNSDWSSEKLAEAYDHELEVDGFEDFLEVAKFQRDVYAEKMRSLMNFYGAETEDELLTGNLRIRASYLQRDNRRYGDMKDRILLSLKNLQHEAKNWFESSCKPHEKLQMAYAWYYVTYHPPYNQESSSCLSFPWILGDILLQIKSNKGLVLKRLETGYKT
ncbi:hypothetical protein K1719_043510 [Acacia pycnantha]|nr:hypothetical protein K1719_043510 [Acacia pycnantha]